MRETEDSTISELTFCLGELYEAFTLRATIPPSSYELVLRNILDQVWKEAGLRSLATSRGTKETGAHYPVAMVRGSDGKSTCPKCNESQPIEQDCR